MTVAFLRFGVAASLAEAKRAAQFASVAGEESGLVYDDYVAREMGSGAAEEINSVAKALGVRVRMADEVGGGMANAEYRGSDILVEKNNPNPVMKIVGHEWTHRVQELAPEQYRAFRDAVTSEADVQKAAEQLLSFYRARGVDIDYEGALDEATANYAGELIADTDVLNDFIRKHSGDRTLLEKLRDALHELVRKLTGRAKQQAQTAEGMLQEAFEAASRQAERLQGDGGSDTIGKTKFSLKDLTEDETSALLQYKSSESYKVNAKLRDGLPLTAAEQKMVADLDTALEKLPVHKGTVYRTLNFDSVFNSEEEFNNFVALHSEGNIVGYSAFTSTSTKSDGYSLTDGTRYGVIMEIISENARDLSGIGNNFESEALFPRKVVFDIVRVTTDENGYPHIYMKEMLNNVRRNESDHDTKKRGQAVQQMQKQDDTHDDLFQISRRNTVRGAGERGLPGIRGEGNEKVKYSLKTDSEGRQLTEAQIGKAACA